MFKSNTSKRVGAVRASLALASVIGIGTVGTLAAWTDSGQQAATFSAGEVSLKFDTTQQNPTALASLGFANAVPGTVKVAPLKVSNAGTLNFNYVMGTTVTSTSGTSLAPALRVTVAVGATTCSGTTLAGGTVLVNAQPLSTSLVINSRALAASASEDLCFKVELPSDASTDYQGANATATFKFTATQS